MQNVFVISGPSGSGQDSIIEALSQEIDVVRVITTTTRKPREGESDGHPYHFVSREKFLSEKESFVESAESYNQEWYGVTKKDFEAALSCGKIVIWKVDGKGVKRIKELYPNITTFFIEVPEETLRKRLQKRDVPSEEYLEARMRYTKEWYKYQQYYDYRIQNKDGKLKEAVNSIKKIIESVSSK